MIAWFDIYANAARLAILRAHPYGLGTAVLNFNRVPALTTAVARRAFGAAVTQYFDDSGVLGLQSGAGSAQEAVINVAAAMGIKLDAIKQQPMNVQRVFLGVLLNCAGFAQGFMHLDVKPGLRESLRAKSTISLRLGPVFLPKSLSSEVASDGPPVLLSGCQPEAAVTHSSNVSISILTGQSRQCLRDPSFSSGLSRLSCRPGAFS